ncbi:MAG: peptidoglycan editing factor PgeF [Chloroflexi bacterium]|nr:peptidoglycan editing factor PgeF [Chloroflexota bacterium]
MPFIHSNGIRYYSFDIFPRTMTQAVFTRQGGVSPAPWDSLNVGGTVGDDAARVRENRVRSFSALGRTLDSLFDVWQVHSADAVHADAPRPIHEDHHKADIILTDKPDVTLYMRFADCVPILFHDPKKGVVAIAHAGWLGTVRGASSAAVQAMREKYGSKPKDILAAIGPSIGVDHYEVGPDVVSQVEQAFGPTAKRLVESRDGKTYLDLWAANRIQLEKSGVEQIEVAGICTACHLDDWFSHRAEKGKTGRFGALIALT